MGFRHENIKHHIAPEKELYAILISFTNPPISSKKAISLCLIEP